MVAEIKKRKKENLNIIRQRFV